MEHLPEQVVAEVFRYLDTRDLGRMAQASRNWKFMTENDTLLRHISGIFIEGKIIDSRHNITRGIKYIETLKLTKCTISTKKIAHILNESGSRLTALQLSDCHFTDANCSIVLQAVAAYCPLIESLEISTSDLEKSNLQFKERELEPLIACKKLQKVKIHGIMHSNFNTIGELLEKVLKFEYSMYEIRKVAAWPLISYDTDNNVIVDYIADEWACYQKFPKTELAKKFTPGPIASQGVYQWSFKVNVYEVIELGTEYNRTITTVDDEGEIEELQICIEFFREIAAELSQQGEVFISLAKVDTKVLWDGEKKPFEKHGIIENGIVERPSYW